MAQGVVVLSRPDDLSDLGRACDAALRVVAERGIGALSVRAIAGEMGVTGPALTHRWENRERLRRLLVHEIGTRWLHELQGDVAYDGLEAFVPAAAERVDDLRAWQAFRTLAHDDDPVLASVVATYDGRERGSLRMQLSRPRQALAPLELVERLHATAVGLRLRVAAAADPLDPTVARTLWAETCQSIDTSLRPPPVIH